jgi:hypothetical protein
MIRECRHCGNSYDTRSKTKGFVYLCEECSAPDVEPLGGNMIWEHKTAPYIEIKPMGEAERFAAKQVRTSAASPLLNMCQARYSKEGQELDSKRGSGAETYANYRSPLGESHTVGVRKRLN